MALWDKLTKSGDSHNSKQAKMLWDRAQKYFDGKLYNRALKDLSDAVTLQPSYITEAMDLMQTFLSQGNDEQALSVGLALLKMDPQNHELMNRMGNALRKLGSFSKAKRLYTMALKVNPKYNDAKYNLAACSFGIVTADGELIRQTKAVEPYNEPRRFEFLGERQGFYDVPIQHLEEESSGKGKDEEEEEEVVDEEAFAQLVEMMVKQLKEDVSRSEGDWEAEFNLGLFYDLVNIGELSVQHLSKSHELLPKDPAPANNLAVALMMHKQDYDQAESLLLKTLESNRYDRTTVLNLAYLYKQQSKQFQTLKFYVYLGDLLAKSLGEFTLDKAEENAHDLFQRRKYIEAVPLFENLGKEKREEYWYEKLAVMYFNQKKEDLFIKAHKQVLKINPENSESQDKISGTAQSYEDDAREKQSKGSRRQAISLFEKAIKIEETAERWVEMAQLYEEDGEEILAANALKKWKELSQQPGEATEAEPQAGEA